MPEENTPGSDSHNNPEGAMPKGNTDTGSQPTAEELLAQLNEVQAALKKANSESAERRRKLKQLEEQEEKRKQSEMTELEKLQNKLTEMERANELLHTNLTNRAFEAAVNSSAAKLKFRNLEDATAFLKLDDFEQGDDGNFIGVEKALTELVKQRPYLIDRGTPQVDLDGTKRGTTTKGEDAKSKKNKTANKYGIQAEVK